MTLKKQLKKTRKQSTQAAKRLTKNAMQQPRRVARGAAKVARQGVMKRGAVTKKLGKAFASTKKAGRFIGGAVAGVAAAALSQKGRKALKDAGIRDLDGARHALKEFGAKLTTKANGAAEQAERFE